MAANSVLAYIVPKLVIQAENAVTDCLFFILDTHQQAADSFLRYLRLTGLEVPTSLEFTTQVTWEQGGGRPDLRGMSGDSTFLVVEAKFEAPLTKRQPVDYVQYLPKDTGGILLFLAPAAKVDGLWQQLNRFCVGARIPIGEPVDCGKGLSVAPLGHTHRLAVASWEGLISTLLHDLSSVNELKAQADVSQWSSLCERLLSGELAGFPRLGDPDRDTRDRQLREMVDAVMTELEKAGHAITKRYRATPGPGYYKRYMTLSGRINWCVEFNKEYWAHFGESLIWLSGNRVSAADCAALEAMLPNATRRIRKEFLIPLLTTPVRSAAQAGEQMTMQAAAVANLLASTPSS